MWQVITTDEFDEWFDAQSADLRDVVIAGMVALSRGGPNTGRPLVDSLYGSKHPNMKELRLQFRGAPVRALFAFDPLRQAIVLCAGDKTGDDKRFYKKMIPVADMLFDEHLRKLRSE